jgi:hypothetical protein
VAESIRTLQLSASRLRDSLLYGSDGVRGGTDTQSVASGSPFDSVGSTLRNALLYGGGVLQLSPFRGSKKCHQHPGQQQEQQMPPIAKDAVWWLDNAAFVLLGCLLGLVLRGLSPLDG